MKFLVPALHAELSGKWRYASHTYRAANPNVLPESKPFRRRVEKHLMPRGDAAALMATWIPYAVCKIQAGLAQLAARFAPLTAEQADAVAAAPESEEDSDDEDDAG